jgi:hypothetical protein
MSDDYKVGYGNPPKKSQWPPGQSGNPRGSSKKAKAKKALNTPNEMLAKELSEMVEPTVDGKKSKMPAGKALMKMMIADALKGSARDRREFFKLIKGPEMSNLIRQLIEESENEDDLPLTPAELRMLEAMEAEQDVMNDEKVAPKGAYGVAGEEYTINEDKIEIEELFTGRDPDIGH